MAAGIIFALLKLTHVSPGLILETLGGILPRYLLYGLILHLAAYVLRSLRFRILLHSRKVSVRDLFHVVLVHNFLNHVLPMRAGELSYIYLVRHRHGIDLGEGLGTLTIARVMDLMSFLVFYPVAVILLYMQGQTFPPLVWKVLMGTVPLFFLMSGLLLLFSFKGRVIHELAGKIVKKPGIQRVKGVSIIFGKLDKTVQSFEHLRSGRVYLLGFLLSLSILGAVYLVGYMLLAGMGYPMSIPLVIFCSTLAYLGFLFPLYSFAGFGMLEAGWTAGCMMAGFSKEMGVASGFSFHIIVLIYVTLLGLWGMVRVGTGRKNNEISGQP